MPCKSYWGEYKERRTLMHKHRKKAKAHPIGKMHNRITPRRVGGTVRVKSYVRKMPRRRRR